MKNFFKNRKLLGAICIVISLIICFFVAPTVSNAKSKQINVVRVKSNINENDLIKRDMIETVSVGGYNLPNNIMTEIDDVVGKYATAKLVPGDNVLSTKLSTEPQNAYLTQLSGKEVAVSISIKSFAAGMSAKLQAGDIITLSVSDYGDLKQTLMPEELRYIKVIAVTNSSGIENSADQKDLRQEDMPSTLTLLVTPEQMVKLVEYENQGKLHSALVYRGSEDNAKKFLDLQADYLKGGSDNNAE